jgi:hypothetical protein
MNDPVPETAHSRIDATVKGFHQVVTLGNHRRLFENFCELYGIKHVHSPEHSTFAGGGAA